MKLICKTKVCLKQHLCFVLLILIIGSQLLGCSWSDGLDLSKSQTTLIPRGTPTIRNLLTRQNESPLTIAATRLPPTSATTVIIDALPDKPSRPSATPTPAYQVQEPYLGIWVAEEELARLPVSGPAWEQLKAAADTDPGPPRLSDKDQMNNVYVLAKALFYARTGERTYRDQVIANLMQVIGTEEGGRTLALGRELVAYVIAADLVDLPADADKDARFRAWLRDTLTEELGEYTLQTTHELRPNNWGTHAGASRAAVAIYLGDEAELDRTARVFKGWLGDRNTYDGFDYGALQWQADPKNPVGINPQGAEKEEHSIDGALPEEMRRGGRFRWPPRETGYAWEALQGVLVQAEILNRAGYDVWNWEDQALLRAATFLYDIGWAPEGDDEWLPWLLNAAYGASFPTVTAARPGKNMGWTNWTHSSERFVGQVINGEQQAR